MDDSPQVTTSVKFIGGLGNRLFQIAAGLTLQRLRGGSLEFRDIRTLARYPADEVLVNRPDGDRRGYFLGIPHQYQVGPATRAYTIVRRQSRRLARRFEHRHDDVVAIRQMAAFAAIPADVGDLSRRNIEFHGYFQHPTWFESALPSITEKMWSVLDPVASRLRAMNGTVISVRRGGDYQKFQIDLDLVYYRRALESLGEVEGPIWVVIQDRTAHDQLQPILREFGCSIEVLPMFPVTDLVRDLAVLAGARNVIMSNSTFCWWGVVAGQLQANDEQRRVFVPDRWMPDTPSADCMIRPEWSPVEADFTREAGA